jgi:NAD(P)H dehydrogenase (quinone)
LARCRISACALLFATKPMGGQITAGSIGRGDSPASYGQPAMSGNIGVIYTGDLAPLAEAFGEAAAHVAAHVRLFRLGHEGAAEASHAQPGLRDVEWADGIALGTPARDGAPAPELMRFIESTEPLWTSGRLYDKVVTVFTDDPERIAPDSVLHPVYDALYRWGAVIVGPRAFELESEALRRDDASAAGSLRGDPRLRATQHRARRLARLAGVLAEEHARRGQLEL